MLFGERNQYSEASALLDMCCEAGASFFDTAEMYPVPQRAETAGLSEQLLGRWLRQRRVPRGSVTVATKAAGPSGQMTWIRGGPLSLNRANIAAAIDGSLMRLQTDYIDLYQKSGYQRELRSLAAATLRAPGQAQASSARRHGKTGLLRERMRGRGDIERWGLLRERMNGQGSTERRNCCESYARARRHEKARLLRERMHGQGAGEATRKDGIAARAHSEQTTTNIHSDDGVDVHTDNHADVYADVQADVHADAHVDIQANVHTDAHADVHAHVHCMATLMRTKRTR
eukprot:359980-Chlamydomonas_euryale.AAC.3